MGARWALGLAMTALLLVSFASSALAADEEAPTTTTTIAGTASSEGGESGETLEDSDAVEAPIVRSLVFPVVGPHSFDSSFGACRDGCTRDHMGNDILTFGWKGVPVVAAHDGTVVSTRVGGELAGCSVTLQGSDGWRTRYVHLNLDIPGTDADISACVAPGVEPGVWVAAGTVLGWVGDSGNAEHTVPHLHFEILDPEGEAIDPYASLRSAVHIEYEVLDPAGLAELAAQSFDAQVTTAYVVDTNDLLALASGPIDPVTLPLVPYDITDPQPALTALRSLQPERIVVLGGGPATPYLDDLRALAQIVEFSAIPEPEPAQADVGAIAEGFTGAVAEETTESDEPRVAHPVNESPTLLTVVAGPRRSVRSPEGAEGGPLLVIHTQRRVPDEIGRDAPSNPGDEANRDALWWDTSDGWRLTETVDDHPAPTIVLVSQRDLDPWTVSFLTSLATSPPMPLWHHQPTSRATKSL